MYCFIAIYTYSCIYVCKDIQNISYNKRIRIYFTLKNNCHFFKKASFGLQPKHILIMRNMLSL